MIMIDSCGTDHLMNIIDTHLIYIYMYSRVIGLMKSGPLDLKGIMSQMLSSVLTFIFDRNCVINISASTSSPKTGYRIQNHQHQLNT